MTLQQAKDIALAARPGTVLEVEFQSDRNRWEVKILTSAGELWEVKIDGTTGAIVESEQKNRSREDRATDNLKKVGTTRVNISDAQLNQLIQAAAPGATPVKIEYEYEHGSLIAKVTVSDSAGLRTLRFDVWNGGTTVSPPPTVTPDPAPSSDISLSSAISAAVGATPGSVFLELELETEVGRSFYKIKTATGNPVRVRESIVDARTRRIWSTTLLPAAIQKVRDAARVLSRTGQLTVSPGQAEQNVLAQVPGATIVKMELEPEGSGLVYKIDAMVGTKTFLMQVNAINGFTSPRS